MTMTLEPKGKLDAMTAQAAGTAKAVAAAAGVVNGPEGRTLAGTRWAGVQLRRTYGVCCSGSSRRRRRGTLSGSATCRS
jgi:hypothetical protein